MTHVATQLALLAEASDLHPLQLLRHVRGVVDDEMATVEVVEPTRGRSVLDGLEDDGTAQHGHLRREVGFVLDRRGSVGVLEDFGRRRTCDDDLARGHVDAARGQDVVAGPRSPPLGAGDENLDLAPPFEDVVPASRRLRPDLKTSLEAGLGIVPDRLPPVQHPGQAQPRRAGKRLLGAFFLF